jgi:hypothetical protein
VCLLCYMQPFQKYAAVVPNLEEFVKTQLSYPVRIALATTVVRAYELGHKLCSSNFSSSQARDLVGHNIRGYIEELLQGVARAFPETVHASIRTNIVGSQNYTRLQIGQIVLTASKTSEPERLPRQAKFRNDLAASGQYDLFGQVEDISDGDFIYGLISHGVDENDKLKNTPSWVDIVFPDNNMEMVIGSVGLLDEYIATKVQPTVSVTAKDDVLEITPKKRVGEK